MTSPAQAAANAANAQLSTGPRTEEGKARSARNSLKHGLTAKDLIVREDEQEEFNDLHHSLREQLAPEGAVEMIAFNELLHAAWNLTRFRRLESALAIDGLDPLLDESSARTLDRIYRYANQARRSYHRSLKELQDLQTNRALRNLKLNEEESKRIPVLVSYNDLTKRTHSGARPGRVQNEPIAAAPGKENAA
jgi:hypothetical protein